MLLGQEIVSHGWTQLPGIIGARPPIALSATERDKPIRCGKLLIDAGLCSEEADRLIRGGDLIATRCDLVELKVRLVSGKALGNRPSAAACAICLEEPQRVHHDWNLYPVATSQEEVGPKRAITSAYGLEPTVGIAVDITLAADTPEASKLAMKLGAGPSIKVMDSGMLSHRSVKDLLVSTAKSHNIPYQLEVLPRGSMDAAAIQLVCSGVPAGFVSIAGCYSHTPHEMMDTGDVQVIVGLLVALLEGEIEVQNDGVCCGPSAGRRCICGRVIEAPPTGRAPLTMRTGCW